MSNQPSQPIRLQQLLDRAATDRAFMEQLAADPLGTAQASGLQISAQHLKALLDMPDATHEELVEVLRSRISHSHSGCHK